MLIGGPKKRYKLTIYVSISLGYTVAVSQNLIVLKIRESRKWWEAKIIEDEIK